MTCSAPAYSHAQARVLIRQKKRAAPYGHEANEWIFCVLDEGVESLSWIFHSLAGSSACDPLVPSMSVPAISEPTISDPTSTRGQLCRSSIGTRNSEVSSTTYYTALSSNQERVSRDSELLPTNLVRGSRSGEFLTISTTLPPDPSPQVFPTSEHSFLLPPELQTPLNWTRTSTSNNSSITINAPGTQAPNTNSFHKSTKRPHKVAHGGRSSVLFSWPLLRTSSHGSTDDTHSDIGPVGKNWVPVGRPPTRHKSYEHLRSWLRVPHQGKDEPRFSSGPTCQVETKPRRFLNKVLPKLSISWPRSKGKDKAGGSSPRFSATESTEPIHSSTTPDFIFSKEQSLPVIVESTTGRLREHPLMWRSASDSAMKPVSNQNPAYITSSVDFEDPISYPNIYPIKTGGKGNTPISRQTTAPEVVSCLVKRGCQDLTANIEIFTFDPIAPGGFSDVYRGKMVGHESKLVAVKVPRISAENFGESPEHISNSARELHTWSKCNHPNVLPLLGLMNFRGRIAMVSPWMDGGNLPRYLETNPGADWPDLCIQVCEGLSHLHEIGIIHGDLKGSNILVSRGGIPVLIDFGNSILKNRTLKFTESTNGSAFTLGWSAPEFFKKNGICQCTKATDVYALGMTIYEVIAGKRPYDGIAFPGVIKLVSEKTPPERPTCIPPGHENGDMLWELLRHCWSYEPEARPSAAEVTAAMKTITLAGVRFQPRQRPTSSYEPETDIGIE